MGLREFESRLERLVEGTFSKAFRSELQPVELGRKVVRAMDDERSLGVRGTVAPNHIEIRISADDAERFARFGDALARELAEVAREHAREEGYHFLGPVVILLTQDANVRLGQCAIDASIAQGPGGRVGALVFADGSRVDLTDEPVTIGRLPTCTVAIADPKASREHCVVRPAPDGYTIADLGSTNGTTVNHQLIREHELRDGDVIAIGATLIRFEAS
ncbi:MAG: FhaA domain-containing protein [Acidimicrobiia bacterium]